MGQQIRELRASPKRLEQRITFEERRTWKAGIDCGAKPAVGLIGLTELRVGGPQTVRNVVIAIRSRQDARDP